jgi:hypothetical protein
MKKTRCLFLSQVMLLTALLNSGFTLDSSRAYAQTSSRQDNQLSGHALVEKHAALKQQLLQNQFGRPLFLESLETADTVSSTAYAVIDSPFDKLSAIFQKPSQWCEVLILHINTKYCHARSGGIATNLTVKIGKKTPQPLADAFLLEFDYRVTTALPDHLIVHLHSDKGPMGTTNYRIELQAVPLAESKSFIKLHYSYGYGVAGRLAMQAYLSTIGKGKVGFTKNPEDAQPGGYVSGMKGAVERNVMRYYLSIEAYLASLKQPTAQQFNTRLQYWFDATEQYSQQLHEIDRSTYLNMKEDEYLRQQTEKPALR